MHSITVWEVFFYSLQKCWRKYKMHPKWKYLELNATANSSIVGRCVIVLNGWGWKKPAEMWKSTTAHTVHGSSFRERIVAGLKQVFEHVLCVDSNCFEQHTNPSCILRHNKKNTLTHIYFCMQKVRWKCWK